MIGLLFLIYRIPPFPYSSLFLFSTYSPPLPAPTSTDILPCYHSWFLFRVSLAECEAAVPQVSPNCNWAIATQSLPLCSFQKRTKRAGMCPSSSLEHRRNHISNLWDHPWHSLKAVQYQISGQKHRNFLEELDCFHQVKRWEELWRCGGEKASLYREELKDRQFLKVTDWPRSVQ